MSAVVNIICCVRIWDDYEILLQIIWKSSYNKILYEYDTCIICYIWDKQDSDYKIVEIIFFLIFELFECWQVIGWEWIVYTVLLAEPRCEGD